eukprot:g78008.t1
MPAATAKLVCIICDCNGYIKGFAQSCKGCSHYKRNHRQKEELEVKVEFKVKASYQGSSDAKQTPQLRAAARKLKAHKMWGRAIAGVRKRVRDNRGMADSVVYAMNHQTIEKHHEDLKGHRKHLRSLSGQKEVAEQLEAACKSYLDMALSKTGELRDPFCAYAVLSQQGHIPRIEKPNQDRPVVIHPFMNEPSRAFFGVFDGHGPNGHLVSSYLAEMLPKIFARHRETKEENEPMASVAKKSFQECNAGLLETDIELDYSGSTGIVVYLEGDKLYSFNVGDSRAVAAIKATPSDDPDEPAYAPFPLSYDHKPWHEEEKKRIEAAGGRCEPASQGGKVENSRVWLKDLQIPGLATSRAFGDTIARQVAVDAMPDCMEMSVKDKGLQFFMLASDGIWEFLSNVDAVSWASENVSSGEACKDLIAEATAIWAEEDESRDDITLITVFLKGYTPPKEKREK